MLAPLSLSDMSLCNLSAIIRMRNDIFTGCHIVFTYNRQCVFVIINTTPMIKLNWEQWG